jgi:hypothetical protein
VPPIVMDIIGRNGLRAWNALRVRRNREYRENNACDRQFNNFNGVIDFKQ